MLTRTAFVRGAVAGGAAAAFARGRAVAAEGDAIEFTSGLWFDGNTFVPRDATYVAGGRFVASLEPSATTSRVDTGGKFVLPGLGDALCAATSGDATLGARAIRRGVMYLRPVVLGRASEPVPSASPSDENAADLAPEAATIALRSEHELATLWPLAVLRKPATLVATIAANASVTLFPALAARAKASGVAVLIDAPRASLVRAALSAGITGFARVPGDEREAGGLSDNDAALAARAGASFIITRAQIEAGPGATASMARPVARLRARGVPVALGSFSSRVDASDDPAGVVALAADLIRSNVMTRAEALRALCIVTPQQLFATRALGPAAPGGEANFLVLDDNPLLDPDALRSIAARFKAGRPVSA